MRPVFITAEPLLNQIENRLLVSPTLHIDEVAYDQTTDVAQPKLARDFICRLEVGLQNCSFHIASPFIAAGIHINGYQRFSLINHDIPATVEPDLPVKCVVDLFLHTVSLENRRSTAVKTNPLTRAPGNLPNHFDHPVC